MTERPRQVHLAAHFPGVNNTTVWSDPEAGSHIEFSSFVKLAQTVVEQCDRWSLFRGQDQVEVTVVVDVEQSDPQTLPQPCDGVCGGGRSRRRGGR